MLCKCEYLIEKPLETFDRILIEADLATRQLEERIAELQQQNMRQIVLVYEEYSLD